MNEIFADVILFDSVCVPYTGQTIETAGIGGSEWQAVLLLEELAKLGKKVVCLNNNQQELIYNNVLYLPNNYTKKYNFKCKNLIIHRTSEIPVLIKHKNCFVWSTDLNNTSNLKYYELFERKKCKLITLSEFHKKNYPADWDGDVINFMIPDWIYEFKIDANKKDYIYASSMMKGYNATFQYWAYLKSNGILKRDDKLNVCLPGYDNPNYSLTMDNFNIEYHGSLPLKKIVEKIAACKYMFYVNQVPETFGLSPVLADILKTTTHIYCSNGIGSLNEVLNSPNVTTDSKKFVDNIKNAAKYNIGSNIAPKSYRPKDILPKWLRLLD